MPISLKHIKINKFKSAAVQVVDQSGCIFIREEPTNVMERAGS
jgi:hypothetical protein